MQPHLAFVFPYFSNSHHLGRQLRLWTSYSAEHRQRVRFVIVDDGSPQALNLEKKPDLNLTICRIEEDVGWNNGGARNLGAHVASEPWLFLCDIDHFVPEHTLQGMLELDLSDANLYYTFESNRDGRPQVPPPNIFLINRQRFLGIGGYDEDLSGNYGGEDILLRTIMQRELRHVHTPLTLDAPDETVYDAPADRGDRTRLEVNDRVIRSKLADPDYRPQRPLRFNWRKVEEYSLLSTDASLIASDQKISVHSKETAEELYRRAGQEVDAGRYDEARLLLKRVLSVSTETRLLALAHNDLGTIAAISGDLRTGESAFRKSLKLDPNCEVAATNLQTLGGSKSSTSGDTDANHVGQRNSRVRDMEQPALKIAILSFLFNWPSSGGGIMHTVGLVQALSKSGYDVEHLFVRNLAFGVGAHDDSCPIQSHVLEFDARSWRPEVIQDRFRQAVDKVAPDILLITDSWNFKPLLAEAMSGYQYILRFDALECLCPLNNIRLLPGNGHIRQCHENQLATPDICRRCVDHLGRYSGELHNNERQLSGVGHPNYHTKLIDSLRNASAVLAVNPSIATLLEPFADRVLAVPSGIDAERFQFAGRKPTNEVPIVLFAGVPDDMIKGFRVLHEACSKLWTTRQDFQLRATGDPPGRVDDFTTYIGWQPQSQIAQQYWSADIVVVPSICQEAMPLVAMEAMGASCPIIASRLGGLPFSIVDGTTGLLFEQGDPHDLARQLARLLDDPNRRREMGRAGRRRFESRFAWDAVIRRHYQPLLAQLGEETFYSE